jgi:outer membrane biogenesis lipoprotein LolB
LRIERRAALLATAVIALMTACGGQAHPAEQKPQQVVAWRSVGSWSGRGHRQTESFTSETGALRVHWKATGPGVFRVSAHSAISGRLLEQVVDHRGPGSGVGYVNQDPHVFYLNIESDADWSISAEEGVTGRLP